MQFTQLQLHDELPLTCSRKGTCCHGNLVRLNPYELARLSDEKGLSTREFAENFCDSKGLILRFNGPKDERNLKACNQYVNGFGCSVHRSRPLACRLFPLGRTIQNGVGSYMFQGATFLCFNGCEEVKQLPKMSVEYYLKGQETKDFETAQDAYLELLQNLADVAFELFLDTDLAASGEKQTLLAWTELGNCSLDKLIDAIEKDWLDVLLYPELVVENESVESFVEKHNALLFEKIQRDFGHLTQLNDLHLASVLMMRLALIISHSIGANAKELMELWVQIAKGED